MIYWRSLIGPGLVLLAVAALFGSGWYVGSSIAEKRHLEAQNDAFAAYNEALTKAREKELQTQAAVDQLRRESDAKIKNLNTRVRVLNDSLRNRPDRPADSLPAGSGIEFAGCTGAGLYQRDAEFLVRLAADAAITAEALNQCQAAYSAAR